MTACLGTQNEIKCSNVIDSLAFPLLLLIKCKYTKPELLILHWFYKQNQSSSFAKPLFLLEVQKIEIPIDFPS